MELDYGMSFGGTDKEGRPSTLKKDDLNAKYLQVEKFYDQFILPITPVTPFK